MVHNDPLHLARNLRLCQCCRIKEETVLALKFVFCADFLMNTTYDQLEPYIRRKMGVFPQCPLIWRPRTLVIQAPTGME